ncbi:hypothetical protein ACVMB0_001390 [Bradyrhizobium sp. USDA 4451]
MGQPRATGKWSEQIPTRFALASKATSPFQRAVELAQLG